MTNTTTSTDAQVIDISEFAQALKTVVSHAILDLDIAAGRATKAA